MSRWWAKCICLNVGVKQIKHTTREIPRPKSPAKISIEEECKEKESLLDEKSSPDPPSPVFNVGDIKHLHEILDEIDKAMAKFRPSSARAADTPSLVAANMGEASKLLDQVYQGCQSAAPLMQVDKFTAESAKVLCTLMAAAGDLHWVAAGLSVLASTLNRMMQVSSNHEECLDLLTMLRDLAKHVVALYPQLPSLDDKLKRATCVITGGSVMCMAQLDCSFWSRFAFAGVSKDTLSQVRQQITDLYPDLNLSVCQTILAQNALLLRQTSMPLSVNKPEYPRNKVGLDEQVENVIEILRMQDPEAGTCAVVLHGMGGIGKSTLGMAIHACLPFTGRTHAKVEVGECPTSEKLKDCQKDLMDRLSGQKHRIADCVEGRQELGNYFQKCCTDPIFLLIDNIFTGEDLDKLLPDSLVLPHGSRIIVTSRDASVCAVLHERDVPCQAYPVAELGQAQARRLLCMQVFNGQEPPFNRLNQVNDLLNICGGLPLALEVVGRYLKFHKSDDAWNLAIKSLQECRPLTGRKEDQLFHSLYFSFDNLAEDYQKDFLDITCLFWDSPCELVEPIYGQKLVILEELALVKRILDEDGVVRLQVHDLLIALGRSLQDGTRVRSDGQEELPALLKEDDMANLKSIQGIFIKNCGEPLNAWKLDATYKSLRVLILDHVEVVGKCSNIPSNLQLCITRKSMPFQDLSKLSQLQVLSMCEADFDFAAVEFPRHLKVLILAECETLVHLPAGFGDLSSLHTLEIKWCSNIQELSESFWQLSCLQTLDLTGSRNLWSLPTYFRRLCLLKVLDLCFCEQLEELPAGFGQLVALHTLKMCGCKSLKKLPDDFGRLNSLEFLHMWECESIEVLPDGFGNLGSLQELNLTRCKSLRELPEGFEMLDGLTTLSLDHCQKLGSLPAEFGHLSSLETLRLADCPHLLVLPTSFSQLSELRWLELSALLKENSEWILEGLPHCKVLSFDNVEPSDFSYAESFDTNLDDDDDFEDPFYY